MMATAHTANAATNIATSAARCTPRAAIAVVLFNVQPSLRPSGSTATTTRPQESLSYQFSTAFTGGRMPLGVEGLES